MKTATIIPIYRTKTLFLNNLINNYKYLKDTQIIIIDDYPSGTITKDDLSDFQNCILIRNKINVGFSSSINIATETVDVDYLMLVNSDVVFKDISYKKAILFLQENPDYFAVSFAQREKNDQIVGKNRIYYKNGTILHGKSLNLDKGLNAWAEGGSCVIRQSYFKKLNGFDEDYNPFYWEDIDLSYRAYKRGWKILFDPSIVVEHKHESTISKYFKKNYIDYIAYRNQHLFFWKNIGNKFFFIHHILFLIAFFIQGLIRQDKSRMKSVLFLFTKLPGIISTRIRNRVNNELSDKEIIQLFKNK